MEQFPSSETDLETIWSKIEAMIGVRVQIVELNRSDDSITFQILNPDRRGQPLNREVHEQYRQLFITECEGLNEDNIRLDSIPSPTEPGYEAGEIVRLVIELDKTEDSE